MVHFKVINMPFVQLRRFLLLFLFPLLFIIGSPKEIFCQNSVVDLSVNPIPNIIYDITDKEDQVVSGVMEFGEPYLALGNVKYTLSSLPWCLLFDYHTIYEDTGYMIRIGKKLYFGTRSQFFLKGTSVMTSFGILHVKKHDEKDLGLTMTMRTGYKFLFFSRLIAEPFYEFGFVYSNLITGYITDKHTLGVNVGFRVAKPNY